MSPIRVPSWWLAVDDTGPAEIEILFSAMLSQMPLTAADLASQMGVNQSTVSRWATGRASPSLKDMVRACEIIAAETMRLNEFAQEVSGALQLVNQLDESYREKPTFSGHKQREPWVADLDGHIARSMALMGEGRLEDPWDEEQS